jgi:glycosyltransferase involved in cell wall biosynthesis
MTRPRICFYAPVRDLETLERVEFYAQDLSILRDIASEVIIATRAHQLRDADVFFIWWWTWAFVPLAFARMLHRPALVTGVLDIGLLDQRPLPQRLLIEHALRSANANVFVSQAECDAARTRYSLGNSQYVPLGFDPSVYSRNLERRDEKLVLSIAWLEGGNAIRKGIPTLLQATAIARAKVPDIRVVIAGKIESTSRFLFDLVRELDIGEHVQFTGAVSREEKVRLLQDCAVYVQPSRFEGFGVAILEAMACGSAVITTERGAIPEVAGSSAIFVPADDPQELANAMVAILHDTARRLHLGREAASRAHSRFSLSHRKHGLAKLVTSLSDH